MKEQTKGKRVMNRLSEVTATAMIRELINIQHGRVTKLKAMEHVIAFKVFQ